jgi:hypothetical protein
MVGDAVHNMNISKVFQPLTGEVAALKTPGNPVLLCAVSKTVPTIFAGCCNLLRETAFTSDFLLRESCFQAQLFHLPCVVNLKGKVFGAGPAIETADTDTSFNILIHDSLAY